ncbi:MAG: hypothetical protein AB2601_21000 [Candidatus Thiodiazotropha sp.]
MRDIQLTPGPLHPDLFGGDTPIMLPSDEQLTEFSVEVCWPTGEAIECRRLTIAARTHEEAAHHVLSETRRNTSTHAEVVDVQTYLQDLESGFQTDPEESGL